MYILKVISSLIQRSFYGLVKIYFKNSLRNIVAVVSFLALGFSCAENKDLKFKIVKLSVPNRGFQTGVAAADLNNDRKIDLVFSAGRHSADQSVIAYNIGNSTFEFQKIGPIAGFSSVSIGNLNGDTYPDVLLSGDDGYFYCDFIENFVTEYYEYREILNSDCEHNSYGLKTVVTPAQTFINPGATNAGWLKNWQSEGIYADRFGLLSDLNNDKLDDILLGVHPSSVVIYQNQKGLFAKKPDVTISGNGSRIVAITTNKDVIWNSKSNIVMGGRSSDNIFICANYF